MLRILVLNSKGGSGKTTLATNLASYYASNNIKTALIDHDSQGSSTFWLKRRPDNRPSIQSIPAYENVGAVTRSWFMKVARETERLIIDSPACVDINRFRVTIDEADLIVIPVLPSNLDIHAVSRCIANLLLIAKINRHDGKIAVVANRARKNTLVYQQLERFLGSLDIPFVTTLRDTQNYVKAAEQGIGIHEMPASKVVKDTQSWQPLISWLDQQAEKFQHRQYQPISIQPRQTVRIVQRGQL